MKFRLPSICTVLIYLVYLTSAHAQGHIIDYELLGYEIEEASAPPPPPPPPPGGGNGPDDGRILYWAHGFMGDDESWSRANSYVSDNMGGPAHIASKRWSNLEQTHLLTYADAPGILAGARDLRGRVRTRADTWYALDIDHHRRDNNIMIAHSFGGLVSRQLHRDYAGLPAEERGFGGVAAFGTPHLGARFARNAGQIDRFITDGCEDVGRAWLLEKIGEWQPVLGLGIDGIVAARLDGIAEGFCTGVVGSFINILTEPITASQAVTDLRPGSRVLTSLNSANDASLQKQAAYGVENQDDLLWRMAPVFLGTARINNDAGNRFIPTRDREDIIDQVAAMQAEYRRLGDLWNDRRYRFRLGVCAGRYSRKWYTCRQMSDLRNAYYAGAEWLRTADLNYKRLAGFNEEVKRTEVIGNVCVIDGVVNPNITIPYVCGSAPHFGTWTELTRTTVTLEPLENDGVVTRASAEDFGINPIRMEGSNHFSMRNDTNTEIALNRLLDGMTNGWFDSK